MDAGPRSGWERGQEEGLWLAFWWSLAGPGTGVQVGLLGWGPWAKAELKPSYGSWAQATHKVSLGLDWQLEGFKKPISQGYGISCGHIWM